jgi:hypothetical protein
MADISISLSQVQNTKTIELKGLGVIKIRRLGSGEDLDLSFKRRRINRLIDELNSIDFASLDMKKPADVKKMEKRAKRAEEIQGEIADIKQQEFDLYKGLLSDEKGGEIVETVMRVLSDSERAKLFQIAFDEKKQDEETEQQNDEAEA